MSERTLQDCRILIVEDEFMLADELDMMFRDAGAVVLGPKGSVADALSLIRSEPDIHGAILDVNLGGEPAFPVADLLRARGVPFVFTTGYDGSVIPARFIDVVRCEKPIKIAIVAHAIGRVIHHR